MASMSDEETKDKYVFEVKNLKIDLQDGAAEANVQIEEVLNILIIIILH